MYKNTCSVSTRIPVWYSERTGNLISLQLLQSICTTGILVQRTPEGTGNLVAWGIVFPIALTILSSSSSYRKSGCSTTSVKVCEVQEFLNLSLGVSGASYRKIDEKHCLDFGKFLFIEPDFLFLRYRKIDLLPYSEASNYNGCLKMQRKASHSKSTICRWTWASPAVLRSADRFA